MRALDAFSPTISRSSCYVVPVCSGGVVVVDGGRRAIPRLPTRSAHDRPQLRSYPVDSSSKPFFSFRMPHAVRTLRLRLWSADAFVPFFSSIGAQFPQRRALGLLSHGGVEHGSGHNRRAVTPRPLQRVRAHDWVVAARSEAVHDGPGVAVVPGYERTRRIKVVVRTYPEVKNGSVQ